MFPANSNLNKLATDLTTQVIMKSQSRFVKESPTLVA